MKKSESVNAALMLSVIPYSVIIAVDQHITANNALFEINAI